MRESKGESGIIYRNKREYAGLWEKVSGGAQRNSITGGYRKGDETGLLRYVTKSNLCSLAE